MQTLTTVLQLAFDDFTFRVKPFPPTSATPVEWRPELESIAAELDFPIKTFAAIEKRFAEVLSELDRAARGQ